MMVLFGLHYLSFAFLFGMRMCPTYHHTFKWRIDLHNVLVTWLWWSCAYLYLGDVHK